MSYSGLGAVPGAAFDIAGQYRADGRSCAMTLKDFSGVRPGRNAGCLNRLPSSPSERMRTCYFIPDDHGQPWMMLGIRSPQAEQLREALRFLGFGVGPEPGGLARRNVGLAGAIEQAWYRLGGQRAWWVYELTDNVDAGVTWDHGRYVRIHPDMWDRVFAAAKGTKAPWEPLQGERFVRLFGGAPADRRDNMIDRVAKRLMLGDLMPVGDVTGTVLRPDGQGFVGGDAGPFIRGLQQLWVLAGSDGGAWPRGVNFGPISRPMGDPGGPLNQLRIHPKLLSFLHCNLLPGELKKLPVIGVRRVSGSLPKVR